MIYFTLFESATLGKTEFSPVTLKKNERGYYNIDRKVTAPKPILPKDQTAQISGDYTLKVESVKSMTNFFYKVTGKNILSKSDVKPSSDKEIIVSANITQSTLDKLYSLKNSDPSYNRKAPKGQLDRIMADFDVRSLARWLMIGTDFKTGEYGMKVQGNNALYYLEHKSVKWEVKQTFKMMIGSSESDALKKYNNLSVMRRSGKTSYSSSDKTDTTVYEYVTYYKSGVKEGDKVAIPFEYVANYSGSRMSDDKGASLFSEVIKAKYINDQSTSYQPVYKLLGMPNRVGYQKLWLVDAEYELRIVPTGGGLLAASDTYEIGTVHVSPNSGDNYCFYSNNYGASSLNYVKYFSKGLPYVPPADSALIHDCKTHDKDADTPEIKPVYTDGTTYNETKKVLYNPYKKSILSNESLKKGTGVKHLEYGTKGTYKDGVATLPYVMIELRGSDTAEGDYKSLSLPANNFVSLNHERNMGDSYNTFSLQLFDKDALQVESWLLIGFRYITFWYTDFVATSKRFKGQVLDYKTTIAGKGLLLTLTGYTSNADIYTGQDSVPWSKLIEARSFSFYYWLNDAGEYHGEVRLTQGTLKTETEQENQNIFNSVEGTLLSPDNVEYVFGSSDISTANYCLKAPFDKNTDPNNPPDIKTFWTTYEHYYRKADPKDLAEYKPKVKIWSLDYYGYDIGETLGAFTVGDLTEPRPSNIVMLIAVINGWKLNPSYIAQTREVTEIPDQVSQSFIDYIREHLIPISMSVNSGGTTQYSLWFDDDGYVHYGPVELEKAKTLYFNAKDQPDTYPLISYTSASNGSILMKVDASQSIDSVNIFTGDEINASEIRNVSDSSDLLKSIHITEEWFATSMLTKNELLKGVNNAPSSSKDMLVSYSNTSVIPSEEDLKKQLKYRYGLVSKYSYKANVDVYGCSDISPGQLVKLYIYLGDGARSNDSISKEVAGETDPNKKYIGNITMHHSSGTYIVNKITDTISGGKYLSSLTLLKLDAGQLSSLMGDLSSVPTYNDLIEEAVPGEGTVYNPNSYRTNMDLKDDLW